MWESIGKPKNSLILKFLIKKESYEDIRDRNELRSPQ